MKKSFIVLGYSRYCFTCWWGFAYYIYSDVTKTLDAVHKPLNREKSDKREEK